MRNRPTTGFATALLLAWAVPTLAQAQSTEKPRIAILPRDRYTIIVDVWVHAGAQPLFVPYCGIEESGMEHLCALAARLEVHSPKGWRKAEIREGNTLSARDPRKAEVKLVPARSKNWFTFVFNTDVLGIPPGARLRIVVDTWPSEKSLRDGSPPIKVTSPEFLCPPE